MALRLLAAAGLIVVAAGGWSLGMGWLAGCYLAGVTLGSWTWATMRTPVDAPAR